MAKPCDFKVTLYPAHKDGNFVVTKYDLFGGTYPTKELTAAGMGDLVDQVTHFAMEHGEGCNASVRCLAPRKPPGFSKATGNLYFNLRTKEELDAEESPKGENAAA
ncbi:MULTISPECIES: hypothetical protein [Rhodobacterales]|uniref:Uncharacterized protein n=1 Tax=Pelagivirga sediminicola TaxID=2170575 RepID=A0A2T7G3P7_9RHOB|nr:MULTISPECIES: hypothetical protein [Rhodobacterales]MCQ0090366.1 hypothetical protein [Roseovarius sp. M141]PVA09035.1 hypothetical protein DC366_15865 [Pelagivirga sediminicola]